MFQPLLLAAADLYAPHVGGGHPEALVRASTRGAPIRAETYRETSRNDLPMRLERDADLGRRADLGGSRRRLRRAYEPTHGPDQTEREYMGE